jgi:hypothetical protein
MGSGCKRCEIEGYSRRILRLLYILRSYDIKHGLGIEKSLK